MSDLADARKAMSEKDLQAAVMETLRWSGWRTYHTFDSRRSEAGFPDLYAVKGRRYAWVEFKTEKGKVSDGQFDWLEALSVAHQNVFVVRPSTMDAFIDWVQGDLEAGLPCHWNNQPEVGHE